MSLQLPQPPAAALRAVRAALDSPSAVRGPHTPALRSATGPLQPVHALPVHQLDASLPGPVPATATGPAPYARHTGWRFLIRSGTEIIAAAETLETPEGQVFSHFAEGPYPVSTVRALHQAALTCTGSAAVYQPRLLCVPGHYMTALWLHPVFGPTEARDLLVPLAPAPCGVTAHRAYPAAELMPLLTRGRSLITS